MDYMLNAVLCFPFKNVSIVDVYGTGHIDIFIYGTSGQIT